MILYNHYFYAFACLLSIISVIICMSEDERIKLKDEARDMFIHGYDSYMKYAYPADELMPLSCKGRYRGVETNRGDVDDALGNFSLTLIDSLDTLVILGNYSEFEVAINRIINDVSFDSDIVVSVFETNIRVVGGLLSGHVLAQLVKQKNVYLQWYDEQLLDMAKDIGYRLLPAFNTSTGIPHPRINLKYGLNSSKFGSVRETCTSCAGTMILEFAALSRLSGIPIFEEKARKAMDYLWEQRHRQSNLVGNIINIHTGHWVRKESGVGAGIDSYYEYCLKAYILLGDENYLYRFNRHYAGIMKYVSQGPLLIDVHMHRPHNQAKNFMDSLLAFWPGLQVLKGDLKPAIETHEILYQVTQKHQFLPEAFTVENFNVHWPHHPLRPEFLESTYFLHQATNDEHYLQVGKEVLTSLQNYTRTFCGYAAVNDVRTKKKEDRMDSFFLAETLKYLYLLFSKKHEIDLNLDEYVFTTEGHLLPLILSDMNNSYRSKDRHRKNLYFSKNFDFSCPTAKEVIKNMRSLNKLDHSSYYKLIRRNMKDFASRSDTFTYRRFISTPRIRASEFSAMNPEHVEMVKKLGISVIALKDGRVQLIHNSGAAISHQYAEEGAYFMQEMISLSKQQTQEEHKLRTVSFTLPNSVSSNQVNISLLGGPAQFGMDLANLDEPLEGYIVRADPIDACVVEQIRDKANINGKIVLTQRGNCMFIEKARNVQMLGAIGLVVADNVENSSSKSMPMFAMSGDGSDDVNIPAVFLYSHDAKILFNAIDEHGMIRVRLDVLHEGVDSSLYEKDIASHLFTTDEFTEQHNSDENNTPKSILDMTGILNLLKSNKLKFDLLSSLNLKEIKDDKMNMIMSLINKLSPLTKEMDETDEELSQRQQIPIQVYLRAVSGSCGNPLVNVDSFRGFITSCFV